MQAVVCHGMSVSMSVCVYVCVCEHVCACCTEHV